MVCPSCGGLRKVILTVTVMYDGALMPDYEEYTCPECDGAGVVHGQLWTPDDPMPLPLELHPEYRDQIPY